MPQLSSARSRVAAWLPHGATLSEEDWHWRHLAVCAVLAGHLPVLLLWELLDGPARESWHVLPALGLLAVAGSGRRLSRQLRSLAASLGLLSCSAVIVHLAGGRTEAHFHFFVVVALVALYQDWTVYVLAIAFVVLHHGYLVLGQPASAPGHTWGWAAAHALAVGAESAVLVLFWRANELSRDAARRAREALSVGQHSVQARLADADNLRNDLIATVSHEFRTPLTVIRGTALTLLQRGDRLDEVQRQRLLHGVLDQEERLSRLLENMLLAAKATQADATASADVEAVAAEVASTLLPTTIVALVVEPGLTANIDRKALEQVLKNLVDNARHHGAPGAVPLVAGGHDDGGVWLTVSNEGRVLDLTRKSELFEPFTQVDSGITRERDGLGVGLFVVRRLVEAYGGTVDVDSHSGWVTVEVRLRPGYPQLMSARAPAPVPGVPVA